VHALVEAVTRQARDRAERDGTRLEVSAEAVSAAVHFDRGLRDRVAATLGGVPVLPTGAGHDAGVLAAAGVATAMLFVRNPTGVSHAPGEHAEPDDCAAGVEALAAVLTELAGGATP
jgi:N-carbamoyl-L-amino-acid hydrolase